MEILSSSWFLLASITSSFWFFLIIVIFLLFMVLVSKKWDNETKMRIIKNFMDKPSVKTFIDSLRSTAFIKSIAGHLIPMLPPIAFYLYTQPLVSGTPNEVKIFNSLTISWTLIIATKIALDFISHPEILLRTQYETIRTTLKKIDVHIVLIYTVQMVFIIWFLVASVLFLSFNIAIPLAINATILQKILNTQFLFNITTVILLLLIEPYMNHTLNTSQT